YIWAASRGYSQDFVESRKKRPLMPDRGSAVGRAIIEGKIVHIPDVFEDSEYTNWESQEIAGFRSVLGVPLLREGIPIGVLALSRSEPRSFTNKQIALLTNFANQAVIAIENTRLLNELRESLQQQTATSEVLRVISSSPGELEPVFRTMLENAVRVCDAKFGSLFRYDGEFLHFAAG